MSLSDIGESSSIVLHHCTTERKEMIPFAIKKYRKPVHFLMKIATLCYIQSAQLMWYRATAMAFAANFPP